MKYTVLVLLFVLVVIPVAPQETKGKILIDVEHSSLDVERVLNELVRGLEANDYQVEFTRTIMYLDPYDVLVITAPTEPFTAEELTSIYTFVDGGGGLLLLGESGILSLENVEDFNILAEYYGIEFQRDVIVDPEIHLVLDNPYPEIPLIENFADHPVTQYVKKIFVVSGCSMRLSKGARSLAWGGTETYGDRLSEIYGFGGGSYEPEYEKKGKDLVIMACNESGRGRIVALGDTSLFRGQSAAGAPWPESPLEYYDHKRLAFNVVDWLTLKSKMGLTLQLLEAAQDLIEEGKYQEAKVMLEDVRLLAPRTEMYTVLRQTAVLMVKADQGLEADRLLTEGKREMEAQNCGEASVYFEKAFTIYEGIGNAKKIEECALLLTECGDRAALLNKGNMLFADGKILFVQGKYEEAVKKVEEAKVVYEQLGAGEDVEKCDAYIKDIRDYQQGIRKEREAEKRNRLILAVIIVVVSVIIGLVIVWKRRQPSKAKDTDAYRRYHYRRSD